MPKKPIEIESFEVKFALNADRVLSPDHTPTPAVAEAVGIVADSEEYEVAFLDRPHLDFHTQRWNVPIPD